MSIHNELLEELNQTVSLFGPQIKLVPAYEENHRAHPTKYSNEEKHITKDALITILSNSNELSNYKIFANSPTPEPDYSWLVLDFDDHDNNQSSTTIPIPIIERRRKAHSTFGLNPTLSVKTPTGDGVHEYYLIPTHIAKEINRWHLEIQIDRDISVEIKIGLQLKGFKATFPGPGTLNKKTNRRYKILEQRPPTKVTDQFCKFLLAHKQKELDEYTPLTIAKSDIDHPENRRKLGQFVNDWIHDKETHPKAQELLPILGSRNNELYRLAKDCFRHNVSYETVVKTIDRLINTNPDIFAEPLEEYEFNATIKSAYNSITEAQAHFTKAIDPDLKPYVKDEFGYTNILTKSYIKKVEKVNRYSTAVIMESEQLRLMFSETVVWLKDKFYVPTILNLEDFDRTYEESLLNESKEGDIINIDIPLEALSNAALKWDVYTQREFRSKYKFLDKKTKNQVFVSLDNWHKFYSSCISVNESQIRNIYSLNLDREYIYYSGVFYFIHTPAISAIPKDAPEHEQPTKEERQTVTSLLDSVLARIVDSENFQQEADHLLKREALMLQRPDTRTENIVILKGPQNTGKTAFFDILRPLYPSGQTKKLDSVRRIDSQFRDLAYRTHIDDINMNLDEKVFCELKAITTNPRHGVERKGQDYKEEIRSVNISMTTNQDITSKEIISGRRWTVFNNDDYYSKEEVRNHISHVFKTLKANKFRLYRVLATIMSEYDITNFDRSYRTKYQRKLSQTVTIRDKFFRRIIHCILNYGYYKGSKKFHFGGEMTKIDVFDYFNEIETISELDIGNKLDKRLIYIFADTKHKVLLRRFWDKISIDLHKAVRKDYRTEWLVKAPSMRDMIRLLCVHLYEEAESYIVQETIEKFNLFDQWDWDENTPPPIEESALGFVEIPELSDEDIEDYEEEDGL